MRYLLILLLLVSCGTTKKERIKIIGENSHNFCSCRKGVDIINFFMDAQYAVVTCKDGKMTTINENTIVSNVCK